MQAEIAVDQDRGGIQTHQCRRTGAPPLKFKGWVLDWREARHGDTTLFLGLFRKMRGGYALALCRLTEGRTWTPHAITVPTLEDAMTAVEQYCCDLLDEVPPCLRSHPETPLQLSAAMASRGRLAEEIDQFQRLAGQALDSWSRLVEPTGREGI